MPGQDGCRSGLPRRERDQRKVSKNGSHADKIGDQVPDTALDQVRKGNNEKSNAVYMDVYFGKEAPLGKIAEEQAAQRDCSWKICV